MVKIPELDSETIGRLVGELVSEGRDHPLAGTEGRGPPEWLRDQQVAEATAPREKTEHTLASLLVPHFKMTLSDYSTLVGEGFVCISGEEVYRLNLKRAKDLFGSPVEAEEIDGYRKGEYEGAFSHFRRMGHDESVQTSDLTAFYLVDVGNQKLIVAHIKDNDFSDEEKKDRVYMAVQYDTGNPAQNFLRYKLGLSTSEIKELDSEGGIRIGHGLSWETLCDLFSDVTQDHRGRRFRSYMATATQTIL
ncbi:hypothetical protein KY360_01655, partial [Candidatus Woesearchaeota archaeon]|nr:hypothetical protein [Candidatus Woesearchaeota archaeon]